MALTSTTYKVIFGLMIITAGVISATHLLRLPYPEAGYIEGLSVVMMILFMSTFYRSRQ